MGGMEAGRSAIVSGVLLLLALAIPACGGTEDAAQSEGRVEVADRETGHVAPSASGEKFAASEAGLPGDWVAQGDFDRKIVKTAELGIRAERVRDSAARAQQIAAQFGGSVLSSQVVRGDGSISADLVLVV